VWTWLVSYPSFEQELNRSLTRLRQRERRHLLFTTVDGARHRLDLADIRYLETERHHVVIHTLDERFSVVATMKAMEAELGSDFFRSNSGVLVNLRHVTRIDGSECLVRGGVRLPVSRARKKDFLGALATYIGGRGLGG
jgi:DNA-binding LytR/AlgR family response regulator